MVPYCSPKTKNILIRVNDRLTNEADEEFPVVNEIARFVPANSYANAFGFQWKKFCKTQLDSNTGIPITSDRLQRCLGNELWTSISGKEVLECGCGSGRFTEVLLNRGAIVTSIDLSLAVEANQDNFPQNDQHRIAQASILELPFIPESFDIVLCLGVIQHTPKPEQTIEKLYEQVKPGGWLVIDHYAQNLSRSTKFGMFLLRPILRKMEPERAFHIVKDLVNFFFPVHRLLKNFRLGQIIYSRISPLTTYYHTLPELSDELQYEFALLDTYDSLTDYYKHLRSASQIEKHLKSLGLQKITCSEAGNGVEARGQKPLG